MSVATAEDLARAARTSEYVISLRGVEKHFPIREGVLQRVTGHVRAVDGVSFDIRRGETVGLVGESGCGKTTLGRCISGLLSPTGGGVYFGMRAEEIARLDALLDVPIDERSETQRRQMAGLDERHRVDAMTKGFRKVYRRNCQVVFQDAFASLNPRHLVWDIVSRPLRIHDEASGPALMQRVVELLEQVGLGRQHLYRYPHQFSGGQRQRISIARALALDPEFVVLDEPTSALDVSVQAQILNLLDDLQREHGLTYLFISHDLNVVRHMSDRIVVMYLGRIAEDGTTEQLFEDPKHPYTRALLDANPSLDEDPAREAIRLSGAIPDPAKPPQGCRFHTRCPVATPVCGWELDDLVRELEQRPELGTALVTVRREDEFSGDLVFDTPEQAAGAAAALGDGGSLPESMRHAVTALRVDTGTVSVGFEPVAEVRLVDIGDARRTACVLHTGPTTVVDG
ncbi:MAG TPA: ABC transporter ATP-binding protein [Actinomycetota bacterium]|nr:ABC transporter ATP-binding protein [Actinomycetota bacterium]